MKILQLGKNKDAIVDEEDIHHLRQWRWSVAPNGYVRGTKGYLHRFIMKPKAGFFVDHINGNKLDNRRCNLRICTKAQNTYNSKGKGNNRFKGVFWVANRWMAQIAVDRKTIYLGRYKDEEQAARVYDEAAKKHHKEYARLNFP